MASARISALDSRLKYFPATDELVAPDGRRTPRPSDIPVEQLRSRIYNGPHPSLSLPGSASFQARSAPPRPDVQRPAVSTQRAAEASLTEPVANMSIAGTDLTRPFCQQSPFSAAHDLQAKINALTSQTRTSSYPAQGVKDYTTERLHPRYKSRTETFFKVGKIFSMLWSEPMGDQAMSQIDPTVVTSRSLAVTTGPFGEQIYSKIRRFVVIRTNNGYCNALPISTYEGRGVSKAGVIKSEHTVIYCNPRPTILDAEKPRRGEEPMRSSWIRMDPDGREEKLDPLARLNFGRVVTVQYQVKVKSCGRVAKESMRDLLLQFESVFSLSQHYSTHGLSPMPPSPRPCLSSRSVSRASVGSKISSDSRQSTPPVSVTSSNEAGVSYREIIRNRVSTGLSAQEAVRSLARDISKSGVLTEPAAMDLLVKALSNQNLLQE